jgi:hypothetical protein
MQTRLDQLLVSIDKVGRETLLQMFRSSCANLKEKLIGDLELQIRACDGNLERLWKHDIPIYIERTLRQFSEVKANEIRLYLVEFNRHLVDEYNKFFDLSFDLMVPQNEVKLAEWHADMSTSGSSSASNYLQNTVPVALGGLIGSFIVPGPGTVVGASLGGAVSFFWNQFKSGNLKPQLMEQLPSYINEIISVYCQSGEQSIDAWFENMECVLKEYHHNQQEQLQHRIEQKIHPPEVTNQEISEEKIINYQALIKNILQELREQEG